MAVAPVGGGSASLSSGRGSGVPTQVLSRLVSLSVILRSSPHLALPHLTSPPLLSICAHIQLAMTSPYLASRHRPSAHLTVAQPTAPHKSSPHLTPPHRCDACPSMHGGIANLPRAHIIHGTMWLLKELWKCCQCFSICITTSRVRNRCESTARWGSHPPAAVLPCGGGGPPWHPAPTRVGPTPAPTRVRG